MFSGNPKASCNPRRIPRLKVQNGKKVPIARGVSDFEDQYINAMISMWDEIEEELKELSEEE